MPAIGQTVSTVQGTAASAMNDASETVSSTTSSIVGPAA